MRKALVIGINAYPTAPLKGAIQDATSVADAIEKNGDGSPNFDIERRMDVSTKSELKELIIKLFSGDCDVTLLYFSGHGDLNATGGYIVTPDHQKHDVGVSMDDVLKIAHESKAKDKIIILDCCHSGTLGSSTLIATGASQIGEGMSILTASRTDEAAIERGDQGVFTGLLIDALHGGAADLRGYITPGSVYAYVDQALGAWDQRPVFKTNVTRFTPIRRVTPPISDDMLRKLIEYFPSPTDEYPLDPTYEFTNTGIAIPEHVEVLQTLQKFKGVNLVVPVGEEHMYFAAQNSKSCRLTATGFQYWRLVKEGRL